MKYILVAIDFSKGSIHALKYAINIANNLGANVMMIWVNKTSNMKPFYYNSNSNYIPEVQARFEELIAKYGKKLNRGKIEYKIRKGKVYQEVVNQAKYIDAMMIVAGTHGISGFEEFWIGSNAYKIVASAPCPVLTIKYDYCYGDPINNILLPIDSNIDTRQKVPFAAQIAKIFGAQIILLSVYSAKVDDIVLRVNLYTQQASKYLDEKCVKYITDSITAEDNVATSIINYASDKKVNLISIMTEQEVSTSNLWLGKYAQQIVNHAPIPVLSTNSFAIFDIIPTL